MELVGAIEQGSHCHFAGGKGGCRNVDGSLGALAGRWVLGLDAGSRGHGAGLECHLLGEPGERQQPGSLCSKV